MRLDTVQQASPGFDKAWIMNIDKPTQIVKCMFNPKEYTFAKSNSWGKGDEAGAQKNAPSITFSGGEGATLKLQLFFDTYHQSTGGGNVQDVRDLTNGLWSMMHIDETLTDPKSKHGRPPFVRFHWGSTWSFDAVIESISEQFTMFMPDGKPVRATVDVSFKQKSDDKILPWTNPTSGGVGGERMWMVKDGDTLARIAHVTLGDSSQWRKIADMNSIKNIRRLTPGQALVIPVV
jgi:nucleoid-associated protein YgaU